MQFRNALAGLLAVTSTVLASASDSSSSNEANEECGLYLAASSTSTSDAPVWGIYAGKDIPTHEAIGFPEVAVNLFHLKANAAFVADGEGDDVSEYLVKVVEFLESLIWVPDSTGAKFELDHGRIVTAIPGAGLLGGYNARMTNANWNVSTAYHRVTVGETPGDAHPGRGALSPFYNIQLRSLTDIMKGMEIFLDYGDNWQSEETEEALSKDEYAKIDETVDKMIEFFDKHGQDLTEEAKLQIYNFLIKDVMTAAVGTSKARKVSKILPPTPDDLPKVKEAGGSLVYSAPSVYRKAEWLKEQGRCMDNIRSGPSTLPHAGRGAFATRKIPKGQLVAPMPLVQIPEKSIFDMYDVTIDDAGGYTRESEHPTGQQLIVNYCLGHPESSMLFFPGGSVAAFVNHADEPNAVLQWSAHPGHETKWYDLAPEDLVEEDHAYIGLLMEIVALRDIEPGEEIFINYGSNWSAAWKRHVEAWNEKVASGVIPNPWPIRASDLNREYLTKPFLTEEQLKVTPYPENVELMGFLMVEDDASDGTFEYRKTWGQPEGGTAFEADNLFTLTVIEVHPAPPGSQELFLYSIRWENNLGEATFVDNVPHSALVFADKPGTSDAWQMEHAFRHVIEIPDDVFPQGPWRNLAMENGDDKNAHAEVE